MSKYLSITIPNIIKSLIIAYPSVALLYLIPQLIYSQINGPHVYRQTGDDSLNGLWQPFLLLIIIYLAASIYFNLKSRKKLIRDQKISTRQANYFLIINILISLASIYFIFVPFSLLVALVSFF